MYCDNNDKCAGGEGWSTIGRSRAHLSQLHVDTWCGVCARYAGQANTSSVKLSINTKRTFASRRGKAIRVKR